MIKLGQI